MRLFSYVVARDYGFAPNPFFGYCTLATCKPNIRRVASIGDYIVGTGSSKNNRSAYLVFVMKITESLSFNEYYGDERFQLKKPNLHGSKKLSFGDNIYFRNTDSSWHQCDSHHSNEDGSANYNNINNDTRVDRILVSDDFSYWGGGGPLIPIRFRNNRHNICAGRNHKSLFPDTFVENFIEWYRSLDQYGYLSSPQDWTKTP